MTLKHADAGRTVEISDPSLVLMIGISGCGKSTFARKHFSSSEIVSSDDFRAMVSDDAADQQATPDAFEILHLVVEKRLSRRRTTVVDATNLSAVHRAPLIDCARHFNCIVVSVVLNLEPMVCWERNTARDRIVPQRVFKKQVTLLRQALTELPEEVDEILELRTEPDVFQIDVQRKRIESGSR